VSAVDFAALLYEPLYELLADELTFTSPRDASAVSIPAIDRTSGIEIVDRKTSIGTIRPVAAVRVSDLAARRLEASDMEDVVVTLNGASWRVKTTQPKPGPSGEAAGEVY
jgi:hypothetical protein